MNEIKPFEFEMIRYFYLSFLELVKMKKLKRFLFWTCLLSTVFTYGQTDDFGGVIFMDSVVITASKKGFDVNDFMAMVQADESFYQAFRNLRHLTYEFDNDIQLYDKKGKIKAAYKSRAIQTSNGDCRTMKIRDEQVKGNYYKRKKKFRYYTAKLYDRLFFTYGKICESKRKNSTSQKLKGSAKHVAELKKLIFSPGQPADVPLIGKKTAIFKKEMQKYYNYSITSAAYEGNLDCYVFTARVKDEYQSKKKGKTVIKFLETFFEKNTLQVVARNYRLNYKSALFDFDVSMNIKLSKIRGLYIPKFIRYEGFWDIPLRKRETAVFEMNTTLKSNDNLITK